MHACIQPYRKIVGIGMDGTGRGAIVRAFRLYCRYSWPDISTTSSSKLVETGPRYGEDLSGGLPSDIVTLPVVEILAHEKRSHARPISPTYAVNARARARARVCVCVFSHIYSGRQSTCFRVCVRAHQSGLVSQEKGVNKVCSGLDFVWVRYIEKTTGDEMKPGTNSGLAREAGLTGENPLQ